MNTQTFLKPSVSKKVAPRRAFKASSPAPLADHDDKLVGTPTKAMVAGLSNIKPVDLISQGAAGLLDGFHGIEDARKGYLKAVAVAVALMSFSTEKPDVREQVVKNLDEELKKAFTKKPERKVMARDAVMALENAAAALHSASGPRYRKLQGSTKSRLIKAIDHVYRLGHTHQERCRALDDFPNFAQLNQARVKKDKAEQGAQTDNEKLLAAEKYFNGLAAFQTVQKPRNRLSDWHRDYVLALCRRKGDNYEIVGWYNGEKDVRRVQAAVQKEASK